MPCDAALTPSGPTQGEPRGGTRRSPLAEFYIGAHAAVRGYRLRLLTRDAQRYRTYFPTLDLAAPPDA